MLQPHLFEYTMLDGSKKTLIKRIDDGSIINRFDMTPYPTRESDIVCPHFLELKWAIGCPFECAWCYLRGTLRHYSQKKKPTYKSRDKVELHLRRFFRVDYPDYREVLNTGEVADSLMSEHENTPFSSFIISLFETQDRHKALFLTKSDRVDNLLKAESHNQVIVSFSLNSNAVAQRWEKAPPVAKRIEAARKVSEAGYKTRIRIDPIVPYPQDQWISQYCKLVDDILSNLHPERITLGSLRGLQSTINEAADKSWVDYLGERSKWGKRVEFDLRHQTFKVISNYLEQKHGYTNIALCKEPVAMWESMGLDWKNCRCNCVW
ncbi:hypothetical protein MUP05_01480 [Candidatus Bathyarchaeota archaeon]|nr:hypothetical protein [Candidatus Bathyarchaeota archaeon]